MKGHTHSNKQSSIKKAVKKASSHKKVKSRPLGRPRSKTS